MAFFSLLFSSCSQPSILQFVPADASLVVSFDLEKAYLDNLKLSETVGQSLKPEMLQHLRKDGIIRKGKAHFSGRLLAFQSPSAPATFFVVYKGKPNRKLLVELVGTLTGQDISHDFNFTIQSQISTVQGGESISVSRISTHHDPKADDFYGQLLGGNVASMPSNLFPAGFSQENHFMAFVPNVAKLSQTKLKGSIWQGQLHIVGQVAGERLKMHMNYLPNQENPIFGKPLFGQSVLLNPAAKERAVDGTEVAFKIDKNNMMKWLQTERRWRVVNSLAGFVKIPLAEIITSSTGDVCMNAATQADNKVSGSLTLLAAGPKRMTSHVENMKANGVISGGPNRFLVLSSKSNMVLQHRGGLLSLFYGNVVSNQDFIGRSGVSMVYQIDSAYIYRLAKLTKLEKSHFIRPLITKVKAMQGSMLNTSDGNYSVHLSLQHNIDMLSLARQIKQFCK
jgi:hypothetical protein